MTLVTLVLEEVQEHIGFPLVPGALADQDRLEPQSH